MNTHFTQEDRACTNCKHYSRNFSLEALVHLANGNDYYFRQCSYKGAVKNIDLVTGKQTIKIQKNSCREMRNGGFGKCSEEAIHWQPSAKFKKKKENLFKFITEKG
jgi:hypothetical protein